MTTNYMYVFSSALKQVR